MRITKTLASWLTVATIAVPALASAAASAFDTPFVTRAEAVMLLLQARVAHVPAASSNGALPDVKAGSWYEHYMVAGVRLGIVQPDEETRRLRPDDPVTRAEFLSMAVKTFGINPLLFASTYLDVSKNDWYASLAGVAQRFKLFPKDPEQALLRAETFMTHSEMATAVQILTDAAAAQESLKAGPAALQSEFKLNLYQKISTRMQRVTLIKARNAAPRSTVSSFLQPFLILLPRPAPAGADPDEQDGLRKEVVRLVNEIRSEAKLPPLQVVPTLSKSAQEYATLMAKEGFFGHESPSGDTLKQRMERSGYYRPFFQTDCMCVQRYLLGENLASGQRTPKEVVNNWMRSPSHRDAILNGSFTDTGVGLHSGIWVMHFGGKQN